MASVLGKRARAIESFEGRVRRKTGHSAFKCKEATTAVWQDDADNVSPASTSSQEKHSNRRIFPTAVGAASPLPSQASRTKCAIQYKDILESPKRGSFEDENRENVQLPTPYTPRRHHQEPRKVLVTPCSRSSTKSHRRSPQTPRSPCPRKRTSSLFDQARQVFSKTAEPGPLLGRTKEKQELVDFVAEGINSKSGQCLYVSGPPGTGKSAVVADVFRQMYGSYGVAATMVNCMAFRTFSELLDRLGKDLLRSDASEPFASGLEIKSALLGDKTSGERRKFLVVLDEIDHLNELDSDCTQALFEWSLRPQSNLVLIGIANSLDFANRFLPRLRARKRKPSMLSFMPYDAAQIASVITDKLRSIAPCSSDPQAGQTPLFESSAIQYCSKKAASQTGDLRVAFELVRNTINLVETEAKLKVLSGEASGSPRSYLRTPLGENPNLASNPTRGAPAPSPATDHLPLIPTRANLGHVSRVCSSMFSNSTTKRLEQLNLHQMAILCTLISHQQGELGRSDSPKTSRAHKTGPGSSIKMLHAAHSDLCRKENTLSALTITEFADVISGLEAQGLVANDLGNGKTQSKRILKRGRPDERRMFSTVDSKDMRSCWKGPAASILKHFII